MTERKKISVLLADDETHIRVLIRQLFISMGAEVVAEAANGEDALAAFMEKKPDITLLDINMPRMNGKDALKKIKEQSPGAFVIMLTSLAAMDVVKECLDLGAANYIRKDTPTAEIKKFILESWKDYLASRKESSSG
ncbi:MAG: response regulator transcription factor [Nitrospinota bacterium]|nr:response regulator transcription factor [Nitrospinota bacterium]